jgi:hypothetical protein
VVFDNVSDGPMATVIPLVIGVGFVGNIDADAVAGG